MPNFKPTLILVLTLFTCDVAFGAQVDKVVPSLWEDSMHDSIIITVIGSGLQGSATNVSLISVSETVIGDVLSSNTTVIQVRLNSTSMVDPLTIRVFLDGTAATVSSGPHLIPLPALEAKNVDNMWADGTEYVGFDSEVKPPQPNSLRVQLRTDVISTTTIYVCVFSARDAAGKALNVSYFPQAGEQQLSTTTIDCVIPDLKHLPAQTVFIDVYMQLPASATTGSLLLQNSRWAARMPKHTPLNITSHSYIDSISPVQNVGTLGGESITITGGGFPVDRFPTCIFSAGGWHGISLSERVLSGVEPSAQPLWPPHVTNATGSSTQVVCPVPHIPFNATSINTFLFSPGTWPPVSSKVFVQNFDITMLPMHSNASTLHGQGFPDVGGSLLSVKVGGLKAGKSSCKFGHQVLDAEVSADRKVLTCLTPQNLTETVSSLPFSVMVESEEALNQQHSRTPMTVFHPRILSMTPPSVPVDETQCVTLTGVGFAGPDTANLSRYPIPGVQVQLDNSLNLGSLISNLMFQDSPTFIANSGASHPVCTNNTIISRDLPCLVPDSSVAEAICLPSKDLAQSETSKVKGLWSCDDGIRSDLRMLIGSLCSRIVTFPTSDGGSTDFCECGGAAWRSKTALVFGPTPRRTGHSINMRVMLKYERNQTSESQSSVLFSFQAPEVASVTPGSIQPYSISTVTISGKNFAGEVSNSRQSFTNLWLGSTKMDVLTVLSDSRITARVQPGVGDVPIDFSLVDLGQPVNVSIQQKLKYSGPEITSVEPLVIGSQGGGVPITLQGSNFGSQEGTPGGVLSSSLPHALSLTIGGSPCQQALVYYNHTFIVCPSVPPGVGPNKAVRLTVGNQAITAAATVDYASPSLSSVKRTNGPPIGQTLLTIFGQSLGLVDTSAVASIGSSNCASTSWVSQSAVVCRSAAGFGSSHNISMAFGESLALLPKSFSFDAPGISHISPPNAPVTASVVTLNGQNFGGGTLDVPSVHVGSSSCRSVQRISDTSVKCVAVEGSIPSLVVSLLAGNQETVANQTFSYDSPLISTALASIPSTGNQLLTVLGRNFGITSPQSVALEQSDFFESGTERWLSDSSMTVKVVPGTGGNYSANAIVNGRFSNITQPFSYKAPVVQTLVPSVVDNSGGMVTVFGQNFGISNYTSPIFERDKNCSANCVTTGSGFCQCRFSYSSSSSKFNVEEGVKSQCNLQQSIWTSDSSIVASLSAGYGADIPLAVHTDQQASQDFFVSFIHNPVVCAISPSISGSKGGAIATIVGSNFGVPSYSQRRPIYAKVGGSLCQNSLVVSDTSLHCTLSESLFGSAVVEVELPSQATASSPFPPFEPLPTWPAADAIIRRQQPAVTSVSPANVPTHGGIITVFGIEFGVNASHAVPLVGDSRCQPTIWTSESSVQCYTANAEAGIEASLKVDFPSRGIFSSSVNMSFDPIQVTAVTPGNVPIVGAVTVTLTGESFGNIRDMQASLGASSLLGPTWLSHSSLQGTVTSGIGLGYDLEITSSGMKSSRQGVFSYDLPRVSSVSPSKVPNIPADSLLDSPRVNFDVTLFGSDFGPNVVATFGAACRSTAWVSSTQLVCRVGGRWGGGPQTGRFETTPIQINTVTPSMDGPVVTLPSSDVVVGTLDGVVVSTTTGPFDTQGGARFSVTGTNFMVPGTIIDVRVGASSAASSSINRISDTSLTASIPPGVGSHHVSVAVNGSAYPPLQFDSSADPAVFSFLAPSVTGALGTSPTTGAAQITLFGRYFGYSDSSPRASHGGTACDASSWVSDSSLICKSAAGGGAMQPVVISTDLQISPSNSLVNFDLSVVQTVSPTMVSFTNPIAVTLTGNNFGQHNLAQGVTWSSAGANSGGTATWVSDSSVVCRLNSLNVDSAGPSEVQIVVNGVTGTYSGGQMYVTGESSPMTLNMVVSQTIDDSWKQSFAAQMSIMLGIDPVRIVVGSVTAQVSSSGQVEAAFSNPRVRYPPRILQEQFVTVQFSVLGTAGDSNAYSQTERDIAQAVADGRLETALASVGSPTSFVDGSGVLVSFNPAPAPPLPPPDNSRSWWAISLYCLAIICIVVLIFWTVKYCRARALARKVLKQQKALSVTGYSGDPVVDLKDISVSGLETLVPVMPTGQEQSNVLGTAGSDDVLRRAAVATRLMARHLDLSTNSSPMSSPRMLAGSMSESHLGSSPLNSPRLMANNSGSNLASSLNSPRFLSSPRMMTEGNSPRLGMNRPIPYFPGNDGVHE